MGSEIQLRLLYYTFSFLAQNTTKEWNPTPTQILHFTFSFYFNNVLAGYHSIEWTLCWTVMLAYREFWKASRNRCNLT